MSSAVLRSPTREAALTPEVARRMPKVLLHDHLDGGVRPSTVVELAVEYDYTALPTTDVDDLASSFRRGANRRDLGLYLQTFAHTVGVMQHAGALTRVAAECAEDLAADGVVYAEVRFAPELHTEEGLSLDEVVRAVLDGFRAGEAAAAAAGRPIMVRALVTAMRTAARSAEIAALALRFRDEGVVGFDIAGAEAGFPPSRHMDAFDLIRLHHFHITIHAGEAFGLPSIAEALSYCGAERLGHGVRIVDDITRTTDGGVVLGRLADYVRDRRVPLEMCPTSNVHTGAAVSYDDHPIGLLMDLGFRVTVNTDNRLMSGVSLTDEFLHLAEAFGVGLARSEWLTINAMKSAFVHFDERLALINGTIKPAYADLRSQYP
jgi:adenosine deaminase